MSHYSRYNTSSHFHHTVAFDPISVLGDGLGDEINAEQAEQGIILEEHPDGADLSHFWEEAVTEARNDPAWNFASDDDTAVLY